MPVKLYTIKIPLKSVIRIALLTRLLVGYLQSWYKLSRLAGFAKKQGFFSLVKKKKNLPKYEVVHVVDWQ